MRGQGSWHLASDKAEVYVTQLSGALGPATFTLPRLKVQPMAVAPWAEEKVPDTVRAAIRTWRGDIFCLPFGMNTTPFRAEKHLPHGETANHPWTFESLSHEGMSSTLRLSLRTGVRKGLVEKAITLERGQTVIYSRHTVSGMTGPMCYGHNPCLQFPLDDGAGRVSTSGFLYGRTFPGLFEDPARSGYSCLKPGAEFISLRAVPLATGGTTDLTRFPARRGFDDIFLLVTDPDEKLAWTAVTFPKEGWAWFQLKDVRTLPSSLYWISNGGRYYAPWNGRNLGVMGFSEICADFHYGLAESAGKNLLNKKGYETCKNLTPRDGLTVNLIMGVAPVPRGFDEVKSIVPDGDGILLTADSGKTARAAVNLGFLTGR